MSLPRFQYVAARHLADAVSAWLEEPGAAFFAGGTDLLPQMRSGKRLARCLIDIKHLPELAGIRDLDAGGVVIGAAVPLADIEAHPSLVARFPLLVECCAAVGAPPLRNRATLAGNICNASPAADTAVALLSLDACVTVFGPNGSRSVPIGTFFLAPGRTALSLGEVVTDIVVPGSMAGFRGSYHRVARRGGMDLATLGVFVARRTDDGRAKYRVALAAVAPTPVRVREAEALLEREGPAAAREAAAIAAAACAPITDIRGTAEYRREMVEVLTRRAIDGLSG